MGLEPMHQSLLLSLFENRFDMAEAQTDIMEYRMQGLPQEPRFYLPQGPGFYLLHSGDMVKLDYPLFRGLNTIQKECWIQHEYGCVGLSGRVPLCIAAEYIAPPDKAESLVVYDENSETSKQPPLSLADFHVAPLSAIALSDFVTQHLHCFRPELQFDPPKKEDDLDDLVRVSEFDSIWFQTNRTPFTLDDLLLMTLCRYVARMRNYSMPEVDEEERNVPFPLLGLDVDTRACVDVMYEASFGSQQRIVHDLRRYPMNAIPPPSDESGEDIGDPTSSEMEVLVSYNLDAYRESIELPFPIHLHQLHRKWAVAYAECKAKQKEWTQLGFGEDWQKEYEALQRQVGYTGAESKVDEAMADPMHNPEYKPSPRPLAHLLFQPLPLRGRIKSCLKMDMGAIGAIKRYILWCRAKFHQQTFVSLKDFNEYGSSLQTSIQELEQGLLAARTERYRLLQQEAKDFVLPRQPWDASIGLPDLHTPSAFQLSIAK
jgi:hypothetical protein